MSEEVVLTGWTFSQVPIWATCDERLTDKAARVMAYLVWRQGNNPNCWPSIGKIAEDMHTSESTIRRALTSLEENGYVIIKHRSGRSSQYRIIAQPEGAAQYYPDTPTKNESTPLPKMGGAPTKNGTHNDRKEREKKTIERANAQSSSLDVLEIDLVDASDLRRDCPVCGAEILVQLLKTSAGECPGCGLPV